MVPLVLSLSFLIGVGYLILIRSFDRYEKESIFKLILSFIIGGLISVLITTFIYSHVEVEQTFFDAIFKIGTIEEFSKMAGFLVVFLLFRNSIDEIVDGLIYISAVALGFACIENVFYALGSTEPLSLLFQRAIYAVAGHLSFAGYMGIALFINFKRKSNIPGVIAAFILASLAHGLYDGVLFEHRLSEFFHYLFILIVAAHIFMYKIVLSFSRFRPAVKEDLFIKDKSNDKVYCGKCHNNRDCSSLKYNRIEAHLCETCNSIIFSTDNWLKLNKYFRPIINAKRYGRFFRSEYGERGIVEIGPEKGIVYDGDRDIITARTDALAIWINQHNRIDQENILKIPVLGHLLKIIGLRHLISK